ncbi:MAG: hypothetical protein OXC44_04825 [Proteobacteria bacterium]|nr:hypothetical protein [Pseudomonadota bacterium]
MTLFPLSPYRYFGTDGIRGPYGTFPITDECAFLLGKALVMFSKSYYPQISPTIMLCYDGRSSGIKLVEAIAQGIQDRKGSTIMLGLAPTPVASYLCSRLSLQWAVVVSASHNPASDNGFKIFTHSGEKLSDGQQSSLEAILHSLVASPTSSLSFALFRDQNISSIRLYADCRKIDMYGSALQEYFFLRAKRLLDQLPATFSKHIIVDCAHGAASLLAPNVLAKISSAKLTFSCIHTSPGQDNINRGCGATSLQSLQTVVREKEAHLGIALDGDGDRMVCVDGKGEVIPGSVLMTQLAIWLHGHQKLAHSIFVSTIMANGGIENTLHGHGISLVRSAVGDRYLWEDMKKHGASFGGEPSGHLIFADFSVTGDGLLAGLNVILYSLEQWVWDSHFCWSQCSRRIPLWPCCEISFDIPQKISLEEMPTLKEHIEYIQNTFKGRLIWRYSGTEKKLRILVEGPYEEGSQNIQALAQELKTMSLKAIHQATHISEESFHPP